MTAVDDPVFLLMHLRTSFITSDDSGICELLVEPDLLKDLQRQRSNSRLLESFLCSSDQDLSVSPDILELDYGGTRLRSDTDLRVERLKREKSEKSNVLSIKLKSNEPVIAPDEAVIEELFQRKEVIRKSKNGRSALSELLKDSSQNDSTSKNPFNIYKQYDGEHQVNTAVKKIEIYMTMEEKGSRPIPVTVLASATVEQVIGFICWTYTNQGRKPELSDDVALYSLHMTEDDGQVDDDFPALANKEPISKFGFTKLALVENKPIAPPAVLRIKQSQSAYALLDRSSLTGDKSNQLVTVHLAEHGSTKMLVDVASVMIEQLIKMVLERRQIRLRAGDRLQLRDQFDAGLDPTMVLANTSCREFFLVKSQLDYTQTSFPNITDADSISLGLPSEPSRDMDSKIYTVNNTGKLFSNTQVQIIISRDEVNIFTPAPKIGRRTSLLNKQTVFAAKDLMFCGIIKSKSGGKCIFSIQGESDTGPKRMTFEASYTVAMEIIQSINDLMDNVMSKGQLYKNKVDPRRISSVN